MERREKYSGSYIELENGKVRGRVTVEGRTYSRTGKNMAEAKKLIRQCVKEVTCDGISGSMKVSEHIEYWLENYKKPRDNDEEQKRVKQKKGRVTAPTYTRMLSTYENQLKGSEAGRLLLRKQLKDVKINDVQMLINELEVKGYADTTVKKAQNLLSASFDIAIKEGYMKRNVALDAVRNGLEVEKKPILFKEDFITFIVKALEVDEYGASIYPYGAAHVFQLMTGMRSGEILSLTWDDVDWDKKTVSISHSVARVKNFDAKDASDAKTRIFISGAKSESSVRTIPLNNSAISALRVLYLRSKVIYNPFNLVVPTSKGFYLNPSKYNNALKVILKAAHLSNMSSHSLRHSCISFLVNDEGCDIANVASLAGHSDIRVTLRYANHSNDKKSVITMNSLDKLVM